MLIYRIYYVEQNTILNDWLAFNRCACIAIAQTAQKPPAPKTDKSNCLNKRVDMVIVGVYQNKVRKASISH